MKEIAQIRSLSLWVFLVPLIAVNTCLFISINFHIFENTFFSVDQIGRSRFSIPYLDGSLSISRASRTYPQYLIFKPSMVLTAILLFYYWKNNNSLINKLNSTNKNYKFKTFGILSALFLIIHSILLGVKFDIQIYKLFRRVIMLVFIIFEITAQAYLVAALYFFKEELSKFINIKFLKLKLILVSTLIVVAVIAIPIISWPGNTFKFVKHALEWDYFLGVITFYLLTYFMWKKN